MMSNRHPMLTILLSAADDRFPPVDGGVTVMPAVSPFPNASTRLTTRGSAMPRRYAQAVRVYGDERGLITLSAGLAGRRELSVEVAPHGQGRGWGRSLLTDALGLVPPGEPVFAAVSPGNARSLRAFLAVGFVPIGSEVIIRPCRV